MEINRNAVGSKISEVKIVNHKVLD